ncbi:MAG: Maf family protein [Halanaerobiales bacterium]
MAKLVLASASPRRQELMKMLGFNFTIVPSKINEEEFIDMEPVEMVKELARAKAEEVADLVEDTLVIGSDTIVVLDDLVLGKPSDQEEAVSILKKLRNRKHSVMTAIAIYDTVSGKVSVDYEETDVFMGPISDEDIMEYVKTGEPMDKAGAYGIQGIGGIFVEKINGSYFTVMGLPIHKLVQMLKEFEVSVF